MTDAPRGIPDARKRAIDLVADTSASWHDRNVLATALAEFQRDTILGLAATLRQEAAALHWDNDDAIPMRAELERFAYRLEQEARQIK